MFRIRQIADDSHPSDRDAIEQVQQIMREQFWGVRSEEIEQLPETLRNPFKMRYRTILYVAEEMSLRTLGFAILLYDPSTPFCFLDYIASRKNLTGRGIGGALYTRVRTEAALLQVPGLFFECLPDDPADWPQPETRKVNVSRLKFFEHYGARPVIGTAYQTPVKPGDAGMPHLMFDALDREEPLRSDYLKGVVRAILERKYGYLCPPAYVAQVVASIVDDPVRIRPPRYVKRPLPTAPHPPVADAPITLTVNDKHNIHHIRERGYVESPVRIKSILAELASSKLFVQIPARHYADKHITAVHDAGFVNYLRKACAAVPEGKSVYPYVFPIRNAARRPKELSVLAGYYCIDTFTPINRNAWPAARLAVDCTLTAADQLLAGRRLAYSLVRPPGHHAERAAFGGFCYFNNAAVAAHYLSNFGKVAILDIDYHHGNGQQDIFYRRRDVLTISIHGDPSMAYPYFTGFEDERGEGEGLGFNINYPLPERIEVDLYRRTLAKALKAVVEFAPRFLVVCLGLDPAKGDPTGTWTLSAHDFARNGAMLAQLRLPTLVVQEGGYRTRTLGVNARHFFEGLASIELQEHAERGARSSIKLLTYRGKKNGGGKSGGGPSALSPAAPTPATPGKSATTQRQATRARTASQPTESSSLLVQPPGPSHCASTLIPPPSDAGGAEPPSTSDLPSPPDRSSASPTSQPQQDRL